MNAAVGLDCRGPASRRKSRRVAIAAPNHSVVPTRNAAGLLLKRPGQPILPRVCALPDDRDGTGLTGPIVRLVALPAPSVASVV